MVKFSKKERTNGFSLISDEDLSKILILGTNFIIFDHRFRKHGCLDGKLKWSFLIKNYQKWGLSVTGQNSKGSLGVVYFDSPFLKSV